MKGHCIIKKFTAQVVLTTLLVLSMSATAPAAPPVELEVKHFKPDLALHDFWTVPRVPNPGYEKTKLCVKMSNIGNALSSSFTPVIYLDNMDRAYYAILRHASPKMVHPPQVVLG